MEQILKFTGFVVTIEAATAVAGKMMGGKPFGSMSGWSGIALIAGVVFFPAVVGFIAHTIVFGSFNRQTGLGIVAGIVLAVALMIGLFGTVGLDWLRNMRDAFEGGGVWWPVVIFGACLIPWFARLSRR